MNNNVLWKRLYYGLFIIAIGLIGCFCNAGFESLLSGTTTTINAYTNISNANTIKLSISNSDFGNIYCLSGTLNSIVNSNCNGNSSINTCNILFGAANNTRGYSAWGYNFQLNGDLLDLGGHIFGCFTLQNVPSGISYIALTTNTSSSSNHDFTYDIMKWTPDNNGGGQQCDYTDYELKSDITENYCKNKFNNLIDENDCNCENEGENECTGGVENGTGEINWSSIYINNIQHNGAGLINITIPEEIERDYTNQDDEINVDVIGYGYDQEKMQSMVNTQYYTPTPEDMNKLIGKIADFLPLMAIVLLVCYAWRLIKKIF